MALLSTQIYTLKIINTKPSVHFFKVQKVFFNLNLTLYLTCFCAVFLTLSCAPPTNKPVSPKSLENRYNLFRSKKIGIRLPSFKSTHVDSPYCSSCPRDPFLETENPEFLKSYFIEQIKVKLFAQFKQDLKPLEIRFYPNSRLRQTSGDSLLVSTNRLRHHPLPTLYDNPDSLDFLLNIDQLRIYKGPALLGANRPQTPSPLRYLRMDIFYSLYIPGTQGKLLDADLSRTSTPINWGINRSLWDKQITTAARALSEELINNYSRIQIDSLKQNILKPLKTLPKDTALPLFY